MLRYTIIAFKLAYGSVQNVQEVVGKSARYAHNIVSVKMKFLNAFVKKDTLMMVAHLNAKVTFQYILRM
jgi:hypothetical protein